MHKKAADAARSLGTWPTSFAKRRCVELQEMSRELRPELIKSSKEKVIMYEEERKSLKRKQKTRKSVMMI